MSFTFDQYLRRVLADAEKKSASKKGPYKIRKAGSSTARLRSSLYFLNQGERDGHLHTHTI